jgi:NAD+ kinase
MGKVIVVAKRTAYSAVLDGTADPRARELLERSDPTVRRWKQAHEDHSRAIERVEACLQELGARSWILVGPHIAFDATDADLVVSVGGDGTLLAASHNVADVPILGVNSAPNHSVGFFCAATRRNVFSYLSRALSGKLESLELSRMAVEIGSRHISNRVLNEALFCHPIPAATSRYILKTGKSREEHRSSGVWVGTAAGSTAAIRSAGGRVLPIGSRALQCVVREPYCDERKPPYKLSRFVIPESGSVVIQNKMSDAAIFLDGPYQRAKVGLGDNVRFRTSAEPLRVLGLTGTRRRKSR